MKNKLKFKPKDKIIIYNIHGVELNVIPENFGLSDPDSKQNYHRLFGEYFYCGLLLDGQLISSEKDFNSIINSLSLIVDKTEGTTIYFRTQDLKKLKIMRQLKLQAECFGDEEFESETEENFTFHLI